MLSNLLLGVGLLLVFTGGYIKFRGAKAVEEVIALAMADEATSPAVPLTQEEKMQAFEQWVVERMSKQHHTVKDWRTDRNARYTADVHPDLVLSLDLGGQEYPFAVECKWRNSLMGAGVDMSQEQIERYQRFALDRQMPIFLIMGLGGQANAPEELYVIPLNRLENGQLTMSALEPYKQDMKGIGFYYDAFKQTLKY